MTTRRINDLPSSTDKNGQAVLQFPVVGGPLDGGEISIAFHAPSKSVVYTWTTRHSSNRTIRVKTVTDVPKGITRHDLAVFAPGHPNDETWYYTVIYHGDPFCSNTAVSLQWNPHIKSEDLR